MNDSPPHPAAHIPAENRLTRFSDRAAGYARFRPSYPSEAIDCVMNGLVGAPLAAADIGAGTGISSRLLAERGVRTFAIEPNAEMRATGEGEPHAFMTWINATGESTGLLRSAVDLVLYAQAFHWVDHGRALLEARRILRPGGRLALVWNVHDQGDEFTREYRAVIARHSSDAPTSPSFVGEQFIPFTQPGGVPGWTNYRRHSFPNEQVFDLPGLIGRATSSSYCPSAGPPREALEKDLASVFARFQQGGEVRLRYDCIVHLADTDRKAGSMTGFKCDVVTRPEGYIVTLRGRLGGPEAEHFEEQLAVLAQKQPKLVVIDMSALEFIASSGLSALMRLDRSMKDAGGGVRLAAVPASTMKLLTEARLHNVFRTYKTAEEALR